MEIIKVVTVKPSPPLLKDLVTRLNWVTISVKTSGFSLMFAKVSQKMFYTPDYLWML